MVLISSTYALFSSMRRSEPWKIDSAVTAHAWNKKDVARKFDDRQSTGHKNYKSGTKNKMW
jgi:hypothetical protein